MASLTIKNIPDELLQQLRQRVAADRRSLNQQILRLLEQALASSESADNRHLHAEIDAQVKAWAALAGRWRSEGPAGEEIAQIYAARSAGRKVKL
jgi:plasmid stability protein